MEVEIIGIIKKYALLTANSGPNFTPKQKMVARYTQKILPQGYFTESYMMG